MLQLQTLFFYHGYMMMTLGATFALLPWVLRDQSYVGSDREELLLSNWGANLMIIGLLTQRASEADVDPKVRVDFCRYITIGFVVMAVNQYRYLTEKNCGGEDVKFWIQGDTCLFAILALVYVAMACAHTHGSVTPSPAAAK